jgi:hypothetical protein
MVVTYKGPDTNNNVIYLSSKTGQGYAGAEIQYSNNNNYLGINSLSPFSITAD